MDGELPDFEKNDDLYDQTMKICVEVLNEVHKRKLWEKASFFEMKNFPEPIPSPLAQRIEDDLRAKMKDKNSPIALKIGMRFFNEDYNFSDAFVASWGCELPKFEYK